MLHKPATEVCTRGLKDIHGSKFVHSTPCRNTTSPESYAIPWDSMNESCRENTYQNSTIVTDDAVRKISALEDELNRLRAQIAGFVLKQENPDDTCRCHYNVWLMYLLIIVINLSRKCIKGLAHYLGGKQKFDISNEGPVSGITSQGSMWVDLWYNCCLLSAIPTLAMVWNL